MKEPIKNSQIIKILRFVISKQKFHNQIFYWIDFDWKKGINIEPKFTTSHKNFLQTMASPKFLIVFCALFTFAVCLNNFVLIEGKTFFPGTKTKFQEKIYWFDSCLTSWIGDVNTAFNINITNVPAYSNQNTPPYEAINLVLNNTVPADQPQLYLSIGGDSSSPAVTPYKFNVWTGTVILQYYYGKLGGIVFDFYISSDFSQAFNSVVPTAGSYRFTIDGLSWSISTSSVNSSIMASGITYYCSRTFTTPTTSTWNDVGCNKLCNDDCDHALPCAFYY